MANNLPALLVETEALVYAREMIARFHRSTNPWSNDSPLTTNASRACVRHLMRLWAYNTAAGRMRMVELALGGEPDADAVLRELMLETKSRGYLLTTELEYYNMVVLHGGQPRPQPPAQKKKNKMIRNLCIALTVAALVDRFNLPPTGRSPRRRSACSIVAEALGKEYMHLSEAAVRKIWDTCGRVMPTVPGWASA